MDRIKDFPFDKMLDILSTKNILRGAVMFLLFATFIHVCNDIINMLIR